MKNIYLILLITFFVFKIKEVKSQLDSLPPNLVTYYEDNGFIYFNQNALEEQKLFIDHKDKFFEKIQDEMVLKKTWTDKQLFLKHNRYQQKYAGIDVEGCEFTEHVSGMYVLAANGKICSEIYKKEPEGWMSEEDAVEYLLNHLPNDDFAWYHSDWEEQAKLDANDPNASYYPKGNILFALNSFENIQFDIPEEDFTPAWRFEVFSVDPYYHKQYFVDANTGEVFRESSLDLHNGPADVTNEGTKTIDTRWFGGLVSAHILHTDDNRRNIKTRYYNADPWWLNTDISDDDDIWGTSEVNATDVHWAMQTSYDFFETEYGRYGMRDTITDPILRVSVSKNSNSPADLAPTAYTLPGLNTFDRISIRYTDLGFTGTLGVCAHEYMHGITTHTAFLKYEYESGALNESFSDIFGFVVKNHINNNYDWTIAQGLLTHHRRLDEPKLAGRHYLVDAATNSCVLGIGQPDTYLGQNWYSNSCVDLTVHGNSGVQNHWFYILSEGKTGTNDLGDNYNVSGIGLSDATDITYYNLTNIMQELSQYEDAKSGAIMSALFLFGQCSNQVIQTNKAWHAVGLGEIQNCEVLSIGNTSEIEVSIYPNPTKSKLFIDNISIDNISIFGLDGKKIMIQNNNSNYIDVSFLSKGIYYLSIKHDNKVSVKKFIKD